MIGPHAFYRCPSPRGPRPRTEPGASAIDLPEYGVTGLDVPDAGVGPDDGDLAWPVLDETRRNPRLARVVDRLAGELDERVRTDAEDKADATAEDLVADRYLLLTRMASRYRAVAHGRCRRGSAGAAVMLAAIHRLVHSGRLLVP